MSQKKIPVSAPQAPLQSPFSALEMEGLPSGPEIAPAESKIEVGRGAPTPLCLKSKIRRPRVVLRREKSNRGGKTVVVISQLPTHLSPPEIENLSRDARKVLGCGGSVRGREIELQGDQPQRVREYLEKHGYDVAGP